MTDADNVESRTKRADNFGDIADLILERETACPLRHVTGIEPVGHRNHFAVPEEVEHEVTEQYRKTSCKGSDHQDLVCLGIGTRRRRRGPRTDR